MTAEPGGIQLRDARVRYGPLEALHGVTLAAPARALTVLLGPNGSGRTTALRALAGTVRLSAGSVVWDGADVTRLTAHARAAAGLRFVPDRQAVFAGLTVTENLRQAANKRDFGAALDAYPELHPLLARRAGTLSGGEQRMLAVSRALLAPARVVLVDEPTQGMAPPVAIRTYALLRALDACVVLAEQRLPPGLRGAPDGAPVFVYELGRGTVVFRGEAAETAPPDLPDLPDPPDPTTSSGRE
ncbi:ATP-binding cassette domain-containing protein [Streptomyces endophyticus]|uniref:ATP-binding cassette domain-containing protein n=1 Tax=Streptomyces endophyticus TaxID=714166 RepID=A0ABU6FGT4_9ACTN|nr:ATP-binding cassette domain-containing protein [Streptomyces endophyticus]MEB8343281.1 ATP-binding cassette domain-containing protein [Streptomyces endophyticus]